MSDSALGATHGDILRLVLTSGAVVTAGGVAAGLLLSAAATRLLDSLLYGVSDRRCLHLRMGHDPADCFRTPGDLHSGTACDANQRSSGIANR